MINAWDMHMSVPMWDLAVILRCVWIPESWVSCL